MEEIFQRILEIENRAKEVYKDAEQEKKQMREALMHELQERESEIQLMADEKIKQLAMRSKKETDERINRMNQLMEEKIIYLESMFKNNRKEWETTLFNKVIGEQDVSEI